MFSSVKNSYLNITQFKIQMLSMIHLRYSQIIQIKLQFHSLALFSSCNCSLSARFTSGQRIPIFTCRSSTKLRVNNWLIFGIKKWLCTIFLCRPKHLTSQLQRESRWIIFPFQWLSWRPSMTMKKETAFAVST